MHDGKMYWLWKWNASLLYILNSLGFDSSESPSDQVTTESSTLPNVSGIENNNVTINSKLINIT